MQIRPVDGHTDMTKLIVAF